MIIKRILQMFKAKDKVTLYSMYRDIRDIPDSIFNQYVKNGGTNHLKAIYR